jgi:hypothetical protein
MTIDVNTNPAQFIETALNEVAVRALAADGRIEVRRYRCGTRSRLAERGTPRCGSF